MLARMKRAVEAFAASGDGTATGTSFGERNPVYRTQTGFILAACQLYGATLAAAAPDDGEPLDAVTLYDMGFRLGWRGRWSGLIEVARDGDVILTPFDGTPTNGVWVGVTRERDGHTPRTVRAPAAAVFEVALPVPPVAAGTSTNDLLTALETALCSDAERALSGRAVLVMDRGMAALGADARATITKSLQDGYGDATKRGDVPVLPPGVSPATMGGTEAAGRMVDARNQVFTEVEAQYGVTGLLRPASDGASAHAHWRLAVVKTFAPMAKLIEAEAVRKLAERVTLDRSAWFAAAHGDRARLIVARSRAVSQLAALEGVTVEQARAMVASFDDD